MKKYTIIGGVNGVGKSSFTGVLTRTCSDLGIIVDTDSLTAKNGGDKLKGGKKAVGIIFDCLDKGLNFTQETTLSGKKTLRTIKKARERDYFIRLFYISVNSLEESLFRIENRVRKGGHGIPEDDVKRRFEKRFDDLLDIIDFCDEVHFFDNENGFVFIGEYRNGELFTVGERAPDWLSQFKEQLEKNRNIL